MFKKSFVIAFVLMPLAACQTTTSYIDAEDKGTNIVSALSYADFKGAADSMAGELIASPLMTHPEPRGRYVIHISDVTNDTMQRIDTDQLVKSMRVKMLNSGKFLITTAFNGEDSSTREMRKLKDSKMVNQASVKGDGQVYAPDFSLSGKIMQRNASLDSGDTRIEYYFQLSMTNIENGLAYWEGERVVGKVADGDSVSW